MWNRNNKNEIRKLQIKINDVSKIAIGLPGANVRCVREALENGYFDQNTLYIGIERDAMVCRRIQQQLDQLDINYILYNNELCSLDLDEILGDNLIDFAFLDFCGELTPHIALWFNKFQHKFKKNSILSVTFSSVVRRGILAPEYMNIFDNPDMGVLMKLISSNTNFFKWPGVKLHYNQFNWSLATLSLLFDALNERKVDIIFALHYRDTTPMIGVKLCVKEKVNKQSNRLNQVLQEYEKRVGREVQLGKLIQRKLIMSNSRDWQSLKLPKRMAPATKAALVRQAKRGVRPKTLTPQQWAWHPLNPNSRRAKVRA